MDFHAIFNPHDIRGIWNQTLTSAGVSSIIQAVGQTLGHNEGQTTIIIGRDGRLSSPLLRDLAVCTLNRMGINVVDLGIVPTEVVYFATIMLEHPAIMITASHNIAPWNGFKLTRAHGAPVGEASGLNEIRSLAEAFFDQGASTVPADKQGSVTLRDDIPERYRDYVLGFFPRAQTKGRKRRIVVDYAHGVASVMADLFFNQLAVNVIAINKEIDGTFPAHVPNPIDTANLAQLCAAVKKHNADFGIAFDGDGDRIALVDQRGMPVEPAHLQAWLATLLLQRYPNSPVVYSEVSSQLVPDTIQAHGGTPVRAPVGHSAIKHIIRQHHAIGAIEHSGHNYFAILNGADSSMTALCYVIEAMVVVNRRLSTMVKPKSLWYTTGEINFGYDPSTDCIAQVVAQLNEQGMSFERLLDGGIRVNVQGDKSDVSESACLKQQKAANFLQSDTNDVAESACCITIRKSNTEPVVRLKLESDKPDALAPYQDFFVQLLAKAGVQVSMGEKQDSPTTTPRMYPNDDSPTSF